MIIFQYFDGCPNAEATYENLMGLVEDKLINSPEIKVVKIESIDEAESKQFQGSPTILVNGRDIYTEEEPKGFSYACRMYVINGMQTGVLPKEYILQQITKLKTKL